MDRLCKFAVLRYVPDENREEFINIGLVFHSPEDGYINLEITSNFSRVTAFDDEINTNFLKVVLDGVKQDFTQSTVHGPSLDEVNAFDYLERATSIYINQLQFSPIRVIRSKDILKDEKNLFRTFVYFDSHKAKRITDDEVKTIMNRVFRQTEAFRKLNRNVNLELGSEEIKFDYAYKPKNMDKSRLIKTLSFDFSKSYSNRATQIAKEWAWNFSKIRDKIHVIDHPLVKENEIDLVTLVYFKEENKNIKTAIEILGEASDIFEAKDEKTIELFANRITDELSE